VIDHHGGQFSKGGIDDAGHDLGVGAFGKRGEPDHIGEEDGGEAPFLHRLA
jgi:hypothetical protein